MLRMKIMILYINAIYHEKRKGKRHSLRSQRFTERANHRLSEAHNFHWHRILLLSPTVFHAFVLYKLSH